MSPLKAFTKLLVLDQKASVAFYEALGFTREGADGTFVHLRWPDGGDVLLVATPTGVRLEGKRGWGVLLCFTTTTDVQVLAERASALQAPTQGPEVQPWHTRDLIVTDPDGYRLNFVQPA
jgi:catechol 2,3-dioxygenase-like lactoylglutathione lyase family enzyme